MEKILGMESYTIRKDKNLKGRPFVLPLTIPNLYILVQHKFVLSKQVLVRVCALHVKNRFGLVHHPTYLKPKLLEKVVKVFDDLVSIGFAITNSKNRFSLQ